MENDELVCGAYKKLTIGGNAKTQNRNRISMQTKSICNSMIEQSEQKEDYAQETETGDSDNNILFQNCNTKCKTSREEMRILNSWDGLESDDYEAYERNSKENVSPKKLINMLSMPKINATTHLMKEMHNLKTIKLPKIEKLDDLTPVSKAKVASKITKKLNFKPNEQIFKNLVSLNVSEIEEPLHKPKVNIKCANNYVQVLEPKLSDYLDPLPPPSPVKPFPATRPKRTVEENLKISDGLELPGALELYRRIFEKDEEIKECTSSDDDI